MNPDYTPPPSRFCTFCEVDIKGTDKYICHTCSMALNRETKQPTRHSIMKFRISQIDKQR